MQYRELAERLTPEARILFIEMVELHLAATENRRFDLIEHFGGPTFRFAGSDWVREMVDEGAISDLLEYGLLRGTRTGTGANYEVRGEAIGFYRFLMELSGQPVEQVEDAAVRHVDGRGFARRHPSAAEHVAEALKLQRSDSLTVPMITEIGSHLRAAVFDVAADLTGNEADRENPMPVLKSAIEAADLQDRERPVLTQLVELDRALG